jgi:TRAP-type mannitol/chloroaromatic compound transport system permease small subunit
MSERVSEGTGRVLAWLTLAMVVLTVVVVVARYAFDAGWIALQESVTWMHGVALMVGLAYTLKHDAHVRVDAFYRRFGARGRAWVDLVGVIVLLLPLCAVIAWTGWAYAADAWAIGERSREAGGLPGLYLLKTAIPLAALLLALQGVSMAVNAWKILRKSEPQDVGANL